MEHQPSHRGGGREDPALTETIAAVATPPGRGGIGVVRVSGPRAAAIGQALLGELPPPRQAIVRAFRDAAGQALDTGLALHFPGPGSYTGEDVLELHAHGSPVVLDALVARACELGARRARPGEFTERAFLNGRIDLAQAEAVVDLIDAGSLAAAQAATRSLQGEFSRRVEALAAAVLDLRAWVEAAIDFPEEEIDFLADPALRARLEALVAAFDALQREARQGALLTEGITVVIAGAPNAGKSTLLNRLAGYEAAIVTDVPGTTRDPIRERLLVDGLPVRVIDTAGLRESTDAIEQEGVRRALGEMGRADAVLLLVDMADARGSEAADAARARLPAGVPVTVVLNKIDRLAPGAPRPAGELAVSALTGAGVEALRAHLKALAGYQPVEGGSIAARSRHLEALARARAHVDAAVRQLGERRAGELAAHELQAAHRALGEVTGEVHNDELLGHIFSRFCIGK